MKKFALLTTLGLFALPMTAQSANPEQVNLCVTQITEKKITDQKSAQKLCTCVVNEQAKITQTQKDELDNWVKSGKNIQDNQTFQNISNKLKACGNGIKFNKTN